MNVVYLVACLWSATRLSAFPIKIMASTTIRMTTVAGTQVQGLSVIVSGLVASFIIVPKDGGPAGSPKPKKESPVSNQYFQQKQALLQQ